MERLSQIIRTYHAKFYIPIILLWGSVVFATLKPVLIQSDIRFDSYIERNDLLRIDPGGEAGLDDLVIYRPASIDYIAQVVGQPGDEILLGLDGNSIMRNRERVVVAPRGAEIATVESGILMVGEDQVAILVQNGRRNPIVAAIERDAIRGPVDKIYRSAGLDGGDRRMIGFASLIVLTLVFLPYAAFVRDPSPTLFRMVILVTHSFLTLAVVGALFASALPGDPLRLDAAEPVWWWFPLAVVSGFRLTLVFVIGGFLGLQWLGLNKPWRLVARR
ncbi:MAG: hypothetical protein PVH89_12750 [Gammaproteobacteria bacterium]|jgi:hypothetical protein